MKYIFKLLLAFSSTLLLINCASYDLSRQSIQQGNLLPQEKVAQLKVGMSKDEVAILMGSSLLNPVFRENHWDYTYTWRKGSGSNKIKVVSLDFTNDRLIKITHNP